MAVMTLPGYSLPTPRGDLRADLIANLQNFRRGLERPQGLAMIGALLVEERHSPELIRLYRERIVRRRSLRAILAEAQKRGELRADADLGGAASMLVGSYYTEYLARGSVRRGGAERTVDTALRGLRRASTGRRRSAG